MPNNLRIKLKQLLMNFNKLIKKCNKLNKNYKREHSKEKFYLLYNKKD